LRKSSFGTLGRQASAASMTSMDHIAIDEDGLGKGGGERDLSSVAPDLPFGGGDPPPSTSSPKPKELQESHEEQEEMPSLSSQLTLFHSQGQRKWQNHQDQDSSAATVGGGTPGNRTPPPPPQRPKPLPSAYWASYSDDRDQDRPHQHHQEPHVFPPSPVQLQYHRQGSSDRLQQQPGYPLESVQGRLTKHRQESQQDQVKQLQSQEHICPPRGDRPSSRGRGERTDPPQQQHQEQLPRRGSRPSSRGRLEPQADNDDRVVQRRHRSKSRDGGLETPDTYVQPRSRSRSICSSSRGDFYQSDSNLGSSRDPNHGNSSLDCRCDFDQSIASIGSDPRRDHGHSALSQSSGCGRPVTGILRNGKNAQHQSHRKDGQQPHHPVASLQQHPQQLQRSLSQSGGKNSNAHLHQQRMQPQRKNSRDNWKNQSNLSRAESHTESETSPESESTTFLHKSYDSFHHRGEALLEPSVFDDRGRCVRHPHIRLRKKKMMGGWKIVLVNCPDCCIEGMLRMRLEAGDGGNNGGISKSASLGEHRADKNSKSIRRKNSQEGSVSSKDIGPPITQIVLRMQSDSSVISETTYSTPPEDSTGSSSTDRSVSGRLHNSAPQDEPRGIPPVERFPPPTGGLRLVRRMPFTDAYGDKGWYTGEVASGSGLPHGRGILHYCDGRVHDGRWSNGLTASVGNSPGGEGTTNKKTTPMSPGAPPPCHTSFKRSSSNGGPSRHNCSPSVNGTRPIYPRSPAQLSSSSNRATVDNKRRSGKDGHHISETDKNGDMEEEFQDWFRSINGLDARMR